MNAVIAIVIAIILAQFMDGRIAFGLPIVFYVGWWLLAHTRHKRQIKEMKGYGLSPEEQKRVIDDLNSGNREAALQLITEVQERQREELLEKGLDVSAMTLEIGRDCKWSEIISQVFRVLEFDRLKTTVDSNGKIKTPSQFDHYGHLLVESPIINQPAKLPIVHRDDFCLAASVYDEPHLADAAEKEELLVTYIPKRKLPGGLTGVTHGLHYAICPRGTLDRYYDVGNDMHMTSPAPEKLFGQFVWSGEIKVHMNPNPQL